MVLKVSPADFEHVFVGFRDLTYGRLEIEGRCIRNKNFPLSNHTAYMKKNILS